ncbi:MAG: response regulator [Proteobacteria bacterium]|nr:response regulator [Pseudomonadota bacterium]MBU1737914.1 response regulator [Pseudomonadota bacterium]
MSNRPKILLVDDKPENLVALEKVLSGLAADFVRAASGNEALTLLLDQEYALALVDIQMPGMDGFEMVELMRQQEKLLYLPVIFVSAIYREESHLIKGIESGAVDFIVKPIVPQILIGKVKVFLDLYLQRKKLEQYSRELKKREEVFKVLATSPAGMTDEDIFVNILKACQTVFQIEYVLIGKIVAHEKVDVCAMLTDGEIRKDIAWYNLAGTPCQDVANKGFCFFPEGVADLFPTDRYLVENRIESYLGAPVRLREGETVGILVAFSRKKIVVQDFTREIMDILARRVAMVIEWQHSDKERQDLQFQLQQAQKMEAIGTLAGGIAHDFNNILTAIIGYSELARLETPAEDKISDYLAEVLKAGLRAKELVTQILAFSRQSHSNRQPLDIKPILKESLKLIRATIPTTIRIDQDLSESCGCVQADPTQIHQVIMNLCTNAHHAMRDRSGVLSISLHKVEIHKEDAKVLGYKMTPGRYLKLQISDTGCGMKKEVIDRIFEPYFTTKEEGKGTGMGLAVVHGIVKAHHGHISVYSEPGKGSTFSIYLPEIETAASPVCPAIETPMAIPRGTERLLVVDDEPQITSMIRKMLANFGYRVTTFPGSTAALQAFLAAPDSFDLVITDMTMPEMTGLELAVKMLAARRDIPIILCSGHGGPAIEKEVREAGISTYLTKPLVLRELAQAVRKELDQKE